MQTLFLNTVGFSFQIRWQKGKILNVLLYALGLVYLVLVVVFKLTIFWQGPLMARLVQLEFIRHLSLVTSLHTVLCCEAVKKREWNL